LPGVQVSSDDNEVIFIFGLKVAREEFEKGEIIGGGSWVDVAALYYQ
jgi:hypothetical protein